MSVAHFPSVTETVIAPAFDSWLACHQRRPLARLRLFCFPYAGGSATVFRNWSDGLPPSVEVCPVQLPGRGNRLSERPFTHLQPLVQTLAQVLRPLLDMPFALFGHSLGALIGFELARELRRQHGLTPVRLFVSGSCAPQIAHREMPIHALPKMEFLAEVRRLNGTPKEVFEHEELVQILLPLLRTDISLYENYVYATEPPLTCPISALGGSYDHKVRRSDLEAWCDQTTLSFSLTMFPGGHFFLNTARPQLLYALSGQLQ